MNRGVRLTKIRRWAHPTGRKSAGAPGLPIELEKSVLTASLAHSVAGTNFSVNLHGNLYGARFIADTRYAKASSSPDLFRPPLSPSGPPRPPSVAVASPSPLSSILGNFPPIRATLFLHYTPLRRFSMRHLYIREDSATDLSSLAEYAVRGTPAPLFRDLTRCNLESGIR